MHLKYKIGIEGETIIYSPLEKVADTLDDFKVEEPPEYSGKHTKVIVRKREY